MATVQELIVLQEYRPYQRILEAFNSEQFRNKGSRRKLHNVCSAACVIAMFSTLAALAVLAYWYFMENGFDINIISASLSAELLYIQLLLTQIALTARNRLIRATIEDLQKVVDERELNRSFRAHLFSQILESFECFRVD